MPYTLKNTPEDFVVEEQPTEAIGETGDYAVFKLTKREYNTQDAIRRLSEATNHDARLFGYAGYKDRHAITTQYISLKTTKLERFQDLDLKDITVKHVGFTKQPITLGDHNGNTFDIIIRKPSTEYCVPEAFKNYFGKQRFSENNHVFGKAIIQGKYKEAIQHLKEDYQYGDAIQHFLNKHKNNYVDALRVLPKNILRLYIHSYQSYLWNHVASQVNPRDIEIPLLSFGTEYTYEDVEKEYEAILREEQMSERDFILREIPDMTPTGTTRRLLLDVQNLDVQTVKDDVFGGEAHRARFTLPPGSYATMVIQQLYGVPDAPGIKS